MAFRHGKNAQIYIGTNEISAYCDQLDQSTDVDMAETSTFGVGWKTFLAGLIGSTLNIAGKYDGTASTGPAAIINACITGGTAWSMKYFPGGSATGQRSDAFSGLVTNYSESSPVGDVVTFSASIQVTGTVTSTTL